MSILAFFYVLAAGAAALALWIFQRFKGFGPRTLLWAAVHAVVAYVLLRLAPPLVRRVATDDVVALRYVTALGIVLPLLVYGFLSGAWVTRAAVGTLRR